MELRRKGSRMDLAQYESAVHRIYDPMMNMKKSPKYFLHMKNRYKVGAERFFKEIYYHMLAYTEGLAPRIVSYTYDYAADFGQIITDFIDWPTLDDAGLTKAQIWREIRNIEKKMALANCDLLCNMDLHAKNILVNPETKRAELVVDWGSLGF